MSAWHWALVIVGVFLWITFWGAAASSAAQDGKHARMDAPTAFKVIWFVVGAVLGPIGLVIAVAAYGGSLDWEGRHGVEDGVWAIKTVLNPVTWWHGGALAYSWIPKGKSVDSSAPEAKSTRRCHQCGRVVQPFSMGGGMWSGTTGDLLSMPKIEAHHGFVCDGCGAVSCPVCSGRLATERGRREFVCTACGHAPITTIYRD